MRIEIRPDPFDPWQEIASHQQSGDLKPGSYGACSAFIGTMRDFNQGDEVQSLYLEHYQGMTEKLLGDYAEQVSGQYGLLDLLIVHRVGAIYPNDPIVLVCAWSAHRAAAFDGCRDMMEYLKSKATFWKKETVLDKDTASQRWVEQTSEINGRVNSKQ